MGLKGLLNRTANLLGGGSQDEFETDDYGYETDEYEAEEERQVQPRRNSLAVHAGNNAGYPTRQEKKLQMMIVEPESFSDAKTIADYLRQRKPVVINFEATDSEVTKRVIDFVSGATYAVDGRIQRVGKDIFLCAPDNILIDKGKPDYSGFSATPPSFSMPADNHDGSSQT